MKPTKLSAAAFVVGLIIGLLWRPYEHRTQDTTVYRINRLTGSVHYAKTYSPELGWREVGALPSP